MRIIKDRKYKAAQKRLEDLKGFYNHLGIYIVVNLIIVGLYIVSAYNKSGGFEDENFWLWLSLNTFSVPVFWGIGLLFHALKVFNVKFFRKWEERKLNEFLEKEETRN